MKLALAELVKKHHDEKGSLSEDPKFTELYESLRQDEDE